MDRRGEQRSFRAPESATSYIESGHRNDRSHLLTQKVILTAGFAFTGAASGAMYGIDPFNGNSG
jgi:hypothetical protein